MEIPLVKFGQELTSDQKMLVMRPGQHTRLKVTIRNLTNATIATAGEYPVTLSYKWFTGSQMLPIEGDRTSLLAPLPVHDSQTVLANITAPQTGKNLMLRFSLVQEGVAWFFWHNAPTLDIPVQLE